MKGDLILCGEYTMQYILETYMILLTNITPVSLIKFKNNKRIIKKKRNNLV